MLLKVADERESTAIIAKSLLQGVLLMLFFMLRFSYTWAVNLGRVGVLWGLLMIGILLAEPRVEGLSFEKPP